MHDSGEGKTYFLAPSFWSLHSYARSRRFGLELFNSLLRIATRTFQYISCCSDFCSYCLLSLFVIAISGVRVLSYVAPSGLNLACCVCTYTSCVCVWRLQRFFVCSLLVLCLFGSFRMSSLGLEPVGSVPSTQRLNGAKLSSSVSWERLLGQQSINAFSARGNPDWLVILANLRHGSGIKWKGIAV